MTKFIAPLATASALVAATASPPVPRRKRLVDAYRGAEKKDASVACPVAQQGRGI